MEREVEAPAETWDPQRFSKSFNLLLCADRFPVFLSVVRTNGTKPRGSEDNLCRRALFATIRLLRLTQRYCMSTIGTIFRGE